MSYKPASWGLLAAVIFIALMVIFNNEIRLRSFGVELVHPSTTNDVMEQVETSGDVMGILPDGKHFVRFKIVGDPTQKIYTYYVTKSHLTLLSYMNKRVGDRMYFDFRMTRGGEPDFPWRESR